MHDYGRPIFFSVRIVCLPDFTGTAVRAPPAVHKSALFKNNGHR